MRLRIEDSETGLIRYFSKMGNFMQYAFVLLKENADSFEISGVPDAIIYINHYCDNLTLTYI